MGSGKKEATLLYQICFCARGGSVKGGGDFKYFFFDFKYLPAL